MIFKRRDRRPIWQIVREFFWPRGGWGRAATYVKHRLRRLPDPPHRIARGIFAGVFTTFTPFYGFHFVTAAIIALVMRGNLLAAVLATFFGNPLTYVPIGVVSLRTGYWVLGIRPKHDFQAGIGESFARAAGDLWHNILSIFTSDTAHWGYLSKFYDQVFFPYMVGGIVPGIIVGLICYYISVPLITAYQNRRKGAMKARLLALKKKKQLVTDDPAPKD